MLTTKTLKNWGDIFELDFNTELTPMMSFSRGGRKETDNSYEYKFIVPGFKKEELEISVVENLLIVKGESKTNGSERNFHRRTLMECEPTTAPTATLEDGILVVSVPKENVKKEKFNVIIK